VSSPAIAVPSADRGPWSGGGVVLAAPVPVVFSEAPLDIAAAPVVVAPAAATALLVRSRWRMTVSWWSRKIAATGVGRHDAGRPSPWAARKRWRVSWWASALRACVADAALLLDCEDDRDGTVNAAKAVVAGACNPDTPEDGGARGGRSKAAVAAVAASWCSAKATTGTLSREASAISEACADAVPGSDSASVSGTA